jgi:TonB family protein
VLPQPTRHLERTDRPDDRDEEPTPVPERTQRSHDAQQREQIAGGDAPARLTEPFAVQRATRASFDEASEVDRAAISARATALGRWAQQVSEELRQRWAAAELPMLDRAFALKGTVVITFQVQRSGRVRQIQVIEASGNAAVDAQARLVVPRRLPRPPRGPVHHQVALEVR